MRYSNLFFLAVFILACGGDAPESGLQTPQAAAPAELSPDQLEHGIGPISSLTLAAVDPALAERGHTSFEMKCMSCHRLDERYVGPPLGDVTVRRSPQFIMNMILNPQEMSERHPGIRALVAEYMLVMPQQNLDQSEARAILEYLRSTSQ